MRSSRSIDFQRICNFYDLGSLRSLPTRLSGGCSHELFRFEASKGIYVLKHLLSKESSSPGINLDRYRNTQAIAMLFKKHKLPVLTAILSPDNDVIYEQDNLYFQLFPYVDSQKVSSAFLSIEQGVAVSRFLVRLHNINPKVPASECWNFSYDKEQWLSSLIYLKQYYAGVACLLEPLLPKIFGNFDQASQDNAQEVLISHRDLHFSNVLWSGHADFFVIDWDCAGRIDAAVDLLFFALWWSFEKNHRFNYKKFTAIICAYAERRKVRVQDARWVLSRVLSSWVSWVGSEIKHLQSPKISLAEKNSVLSEIRDSLSAFQYISDNREQILVLFIDSI